MGNKIPENWGNPRIDERTVETSIASNDKIMFWDESAGEEKSIEYSDFAPGGYDYSGLTRYGEVIIADGVHTADEVLGPMGGSPYVSYAFSNEMISGQWIKIAAFSAKFQKNPTTTLTQYTAVGNYTFTSFNSSEILVGIINHGAISWVAYTSSSILNWTSATWNNPLIGVNCKITDNGHQGGTIEFTKTPGWVSVWACSGSSVVGYGTTIADIVPDFVCDIWY